LTEKGDAQVSKVDVLLVEDLVEQVVDGAGR